MVNFAVSSGSASFAGNVSWLLSISGCSFLFPLPSIVGTVDEPRLLCKRRYETECIITQLRGFQVRRILRGPASSLGMTLLAFAVLLAAWTMASAEQGTSNVDPTVTADDWPNFGGDGREEH